MNLLANAHDAVFNLSDKWVELSLAEVDDQIQLMVTDSGNGIAPNIVEKMMQPFFTTKEVGKGTGLGLSISKGIIEDHQGTLKYNSQSPHTQFILTFPKSRSRSKVA